MTQITIELKEQYIAEIQDLLDKGIIEGENAKFLQKLIEKAENTEELIKIKALGTKYQRTGFHFDVRFEVARDSTVKFFKKNKDLSFDNGGITHKLIIGDNYNALTNLLITHKNRIKVIYIDPPYGKDDMGEYAKTNYNNAITRDNLLSMLYNRLQLAKQLLTDDGVIFCSIDDKNQAYIKCLFDEVLGEKNYMADFIRKTKSSTNDAKTGINYQHEFLLCYAKNRENVILLGETKDLSKYKNPDNDPKGEWTSGDPSAKSGKMEANYFPVKNPYTGKEDYPPEGRFWCFSKNTLQKHIDEGRICFRKEYEPNTRGFIYKRYLSELKTCQTTFDSLKFTSNNYMNQVATKENKSLGFADKFKYPKPIEFIKEILRHCTGKDTSYIVLDFFAGSGTTGHAVLDLNREDNGNRQFILITNDEKGIARNITSKRLKRIMDGQCYDGNQNFNWIKKNKPYKNSLEVLEISECADTDREIFEKIDESLYGKIFIDNINEKIEWVCKNFERTCCGEIKNDD